MSAPGEPTVLRSRENSLFKDLRRLAQDNSAYRQQGRVWIEGDHLCRAALARGLQPVMAVLAERFLPSAPALGLPPGLRRVVVADALWTQLSALESPAAMGFVLDLPASTALDPTAPSVVLDRVQDAGNVGSILRSAGAFGYWQVLALKGTAGLWSPKVLRAGMGAHFGLHLVESLEPQALSALAVPLLVTSSHAGDFLHAAGVPWPCAWAFGHEGQGVGPQVEALAKGRVRIAQPGGEESLNVAAAAAICLHAGMGQRL
ncbi:RNA methyltransferase [Pseudorhodoferax sp. Leaf267]|uniref:TrmH family RNA methyltransferase n=1 Tax=Pseudorhodoferax sp. Leaf267 TaxID=1736316 RepID=UPI0006FD5CFF|nr:RNA methyltransferase [Pseudorhodoferax sp. Leaf267]KQP17740.1 rRNA methyltransferase [Pseudorhodoferax sp. Leaf267]